MKKISFHKIFCFISFLFILSCFIFYGTRFIKLYLENAKVESNEKDSLVKVIKDNNQENSYFKLINGNNYFTGNTEDNYLEYANILWRIIKINSDNTIMIITDKSVTSLAFSNIEEIEKDYPYMWLNKDNNEYSGIFESNLGNVDTYLEKINICKDNYDELTNNPCKESNINKYFSLLTIPEYLNTGSSESYLNNNEYFYLGNTNSSGKIWAVNDTGKTTPNNGSDILGIRPVALIKANIDYIDGNGTINNPYKIEKNNNLFGSYVLLGNDTWRIYQINNTEVRLMLNDYLKINGETITYRYSYNTSYHDDTKKGSLAYYLNNNYLNTLSYKDIIKEVSWPNGYYNSSTNYDYTNSLKNTINSKVALMSIGNIYLNNNTSEFYTMTGNKDKGSSLYIINKDKRLFTRQISSNLSIVPTISIEKDKLTKGDGSINNPYEME